MWEEARGLWCRGETTHRYPDGSADIRAVRGRSKYLGCLSPQFVSFLDKHQPDWEENLRNNPVAYEFAYAFAYEAWLTLEMSINGKSTDGTQAARESNAAPQRPSGAPE